MPGDLSPLHVFKIIALSFTGIVFQQPWRLLWLCAVPLFILLYFAMLHWVQIKLVRFGEIGLIRRITPENSVNKQYVKFIFLNLAYILIIMSLSRPSLSYRIRESQAADIYIVLDVSRSMLATDAAPSRLQSVVNLLGTLVNQTPNARMGLIPFAGQALVEVPLSTDKRTLLSFISQMQPETIPVQGTLIGPALDLASASFSNEPERARMVMLFTDGENYDPDAIAAASRLKVQHQSLVICGVGSAAGSKIPLGIHRGVREYKKDRKGSIVISKFNEAFLDSLALAGSGKVFTLNGLNALTMQMLIQKEIAAKRLIYRQEVKNIEYPYGLALALVLLLVEFMLSERRNGLTDYLKTRLKGLRIPFLCLLLYFCPLQGKAQLSYYSARKGNEAYRQGKFSLAEKLYKQNSPEKPQPALLYNTASSLFQLSRFTEAAAMFRTILGDKNAASLHQQAWYDLGNCQLKQEQFAQSISSYIQSLRLKPEDQAARYNLAYARMMLKKSMQPPPAMSNASQPPPAAEKKPPAFKTDLNKSNKDAAKPSADLPQDW